MSRAIAEAGTDAGRQLNRVDWLDGVRGLAAFFVVLHHVWLMSIGGYPGNNGPASMDWLVFGHLAVSVFIVVSGFSLTLSPSKHDMRLTNGGWGFLRRRFWRIVPPFWAALVLSSVLIWSGLIGTANGGMYEVKDFFVYVFLVQDAVGNVAPNGVFWSIAVEWHIYFLFPLILWGMRRFGFVPAFAVVTAVVIAQHLIGFFVPAVASVDRFSPAYLILFLAGSGAAWIVRKGPGPRIATWGTLLLGSAFFVLAAASGTEAIVANYFWIDLLVGFAASLAFISLARGGLRHLSRALAWKPLAFVGGFAYSLYLCHAPILDLVRTHVVDPVELSPVASFWLLMAVGVPLAVAISYGFFWCCERPFLTIRSFSELRSVLERPRGKHVLLTAKSSGTGLLKARNVWGAKP